MQKFSEIEYKRPNLADYKKQISASIKALKAAKSYEEAKAIYLADDENDGRISTMFVVASIRNTMDTNDKFYDEEMQYLDKASAELMPLQKKYIQTLLASPYRADFEREYGKQIFVSAQMAEKVSSAKIITDTIKLAGLSNDYKKLTAGCKCDFGGEECNFYGLLKHMESADREERREAFFAWAKLYEDIAGKLDGIYTKMVKIRAAEAKKLGFADYIQMAYCERERAEYGPEQVEAFRRQVAEVIVPACVRLRAIQAKRIGVDKLKYYDETYMFPDGNPNPIGNKDQMVGWAQQMYREMSAESGEFFDFMVDNELFDLETRPGKHLGGYCTWLQDYKAPFIFSNFNGTSADVDVLTHEAGHAFEFYLSSRTQPFSSYYGSTSEIDEIHSMSMEHFAYPWMEKFFGGQTDKYLYSHAASAMMVVPYLVAVDEFQHRVYEKPEMSADERYAAWKKIEQIYLPWRDYDGVEFLEKGGFWMQKQHIFLYPFYYVDYALAQMGAFEFFVKMESDRKAAWADYVKLCKAGGSLGYLELLKLAGLSNPFEQGTVKRIVDSVMESLEQSPYNR